MLEIIAGDLETGVVRFLAVSVKTFVLSVASAAGLTIILKEDVYTEWTTQFAADSTNCNNMDLEDQVSLHYDENVKINIKNSLLNKIIFVLLWRYL
ncbi:MAG: hypothetical protein ACI8RD_007278 [Bacillariaceae sp.]